MMLFSGSRKTLLAVAIVLSAMCGSAGAASPVGSWHGTWSSLSTGHRGPLRARIRPLDHDTYRAVFFGRFAKVIPFVYPARLERVPGTCDRYSSSQRLPLLGNYRMNATVHGNHFRANFYGPRDRGVFEMSR